MNIWILLPLLILLGSCVEGEQKLPVAQGATTNLVQPYQSLAESYPPPSPIPPELAFVNYPFTRQSNPVELKINLFNPNNLPFFQEWSVNGIIRARSQNFFWIDPSDVTTYPLQGLQVVSTVLKDSSGQILSSLNWSFEIISGLPGYSSLLPLPSPTPYPGSPLPDWNSPQTVTATLSNPGGAAFLHYWYLDGIQQGPPTSQLDSLTLSYTFVPSTLSLGMHTLVSQLRESSVTTKTYATATWSFEINQQPHFTTFTGQQPSPAIFPDIAFGAGAVSIVALDPDILYNPLNATLTLNWELDGAVVASSTFTNPPDGNNPPPYFIDGNDANMLGRHSVVAILYDSVHSTPVDSVSWNFNVSYPTPTTLDVAGPCPTTSTTALSCAPNSIFAVSTIPLNASGSYPPGFFQQIPPVDINTRGTPLTGTNTFCLTVASGQGIGFAWSPANAGVFLQFTDPNGNVNPVVMQFPQTIPATLCLDGVGAIFGAGVPAYAISPITPSWVLRANITDKLSLQTVATVSWNINVQATNTPPVMDFATPSSVTVTQDVPATFTFSVQDLDGINLGNFQSTFLFLSPIPGYPAGVALDGTNTYYQPPTGPNSGTGIQTPNCTWNYNTSPLNKFSCTINIPSHNGNTPVSTTGPYMLKASINNLSIYPDTPGATPLYPGPPALYNPQLPQSISPQLLTWNITVIESNIGGPVLQNILYSGAAVPATNSYLYNNLAPTIAAASASETSTITFNLLVNDLEKDNYIVSLSHNTSASPTIFTEYFNSSPTTYTIVGGAISVGSFNLPEDTVEGVNSATITFRVTLTDVPQSATPISNIFDFPLTVTNYNPPPVVATATYVPALNLAATATVMEGFPYSFITPNITDPSVTDSNMLVWQWMVADCSTSTVWQTITGAALSSPGLVQPQQATLTWSPPAPTSLPAGSSTTYCFRACVGDTGYGNSINTSTCSPAMAGPWLGPVKGAPADIATSLLIGVNPADDGPTAIWEDPTVPGSVYAAHVYRNSIYVVNYLYNSNTTVSQTKMQFVTQEGDAITATSTEKPYALSITGNANNLFVGFVYNKENGYTGIPTATVTRITKAPLGTTATYFFLDDVVAGVGQVVSNNNAFWLPYLKAASANVPWIMYGGNVATGTLKADLGIGTSAVQILDRKDAFDNLFVTIKENNGAVDIHKFSLPAGVNPPVDLNVFAYNVFPSELISDLTLSVPSSTTVNQYVFLAAKNFDKYLLYTRGDLNLNLAGVFDLSTIVPYPPMAFDVLGLNSVNSLLEMELILGVIKVEHPAGATETNAYMLKVGSALDDYYLNVSSRINQQPSVNNTKMLDSGDFALSHILPKFTIGSPGSIPTENTKNVLWYRYNDGSSERNVLVNIEDEIFNATGTVTGNLWTLPWFAPR